MTETLTLRVRDGITELLFKVRRTTPLLRIKEAYSAKRGVNVSRVRFLFDGKEANETSTIADLDLDENDVLEVVQISPSLDASIDPESDRARIDIFDEIKESMLHESSRYPASSIKSEVVGVLAGGENLVTVDMATRAISKGIESLTYLDGARDSYFGDPSKLARTASFPVSVEEQLDVFLNKMDVDRLHVFAVDDNDEFSPRDRILNVRLPANILEPFLSGVSRPELLSAAQNSNLLTGSSTAKKRVVRVKRTTGKKAERRSDDGNAAKVESALNPEVGENAIHLSLLVAKAIADNTVTSYVLAISVLFAYVAGEKSNVDSISLKLPVGNLLAALFESIDRKAPLLNPFVPCLLSEKDEHEHTRSVACSEISHLEFQSDGGSTAGSMNADHGTDTASVVEVELDELSEEELLAHAMALSLGSASSAIPLKINKSDIKDFRGVPLSLDHHVPPGIADILPVVDGFCTFSPIFDKSFWLDKLYSGVLENGLTQVPVLQIVVVMLMCLSGSNDLACGVKPPTDQTIKFPSLSSPLQMQPTSLSLHCIEYLLSTIISSLDGYSAPTPFWRWICWVLLRVSSSSYSVIAANRLSIVSLGFTSLNDYTSYLERTAACIASLIAFDPLAGAFDKATYIVECDDEIKLVGADAAATLCILKHCQDIATMLRVAQSLLEESVGCPGDMHRNFYIQRLCLFVAKHFLYEPDQNPCRSDEIVQILFPIHDDVVLRDGSTVRSLETILLDRLRTTSFVNSSEAQFGEILLFQTLVKIRLNSFFEGFRVSNDTVATAAFNSIRCHGNLILGDLGKCATHLGPKAWATVVSTHGFPSASGLYEYSVKIDKCDKGHIFIGLVTANAIVDTYIGGDKHGWGIIGTSAVWHNKSKIKSEIGHYFGDGCVVSIRFDSNLGQLSVSSNGSEWCAVVDNLPMVTMFPAVSLYQRDDKVTILSSTNMSRPCPANPWALNEILEDSFLLYFADVTNAVTEHLNMIELSESVVLKRNLISHHLLEYTLPALIGGVIKYDWSNGSFRTILCLLPQLILLARKFSFIRDTFDDGSIGALSIAGGIWSIKKVLDGQQQASPISYNLSFNEHERALAVDPSDENRVSTLVTGSGLGGAFVISAEGSIGGTRLMLHEKWTSGATYFIDARVSLDCNYLHGNFWDEDSGASGSLSGERIKETRSGKCSKSILFKLSLLLCNACGHMISILLCDSKRMLLDYLDEAQTDKATIEDTNKWINNALILSGGAPFESSVRKFVARFGSQSCRHVLKNAVWWTPLAFPSFLFEGSEVLNSSLIHDIINQNENGELIDNYVRTHVAPTSLLRVSVASYSRSRLLILAALIKHSGCEHVVVDELNLLRMGKKGYSDRPNRALVEIWRASNRIIESFVRRKQAEGEEIASPTVEVNEISNFLLEIHRRPQELHGGVKDGNAGEMSQFTDVLSQIIDFYLNANCSMQHLMTQLHVNSLVATLRNAGFKSIMLLFENSFPFENVPPVSALPMQSSIVAYLGIAFTQSACATQEKARPITPLHYLDGINCCSSTLKSQLKISFEIVFEFIAAVLQRSIWSNYPDSQCMALAAWSISVRPVDHSFLNRICIFRILQNVLAEARKSQAKAVVDRRYFANCNVSKRLSKFALLIVHSLASQISNISDLSYDIRGFHRTASGPDTLSASLFEVLFGELFNGLQAIIGNAFNGASGTPSTNDLEIENDIYRILRLLCAASSSTVCIRYMSTLRWITLLVNSIGCGSLSIQRVLFKLIQEIVKTVDPRVFSGLFNRLHTSREIITSVDVPFDEEDLNAKLLSSDLGRLSCVDEFVEVMLEGVGTMYPSFESEGNLQSKSFIEAMHIRGLISCVSSECTTILRILISDSRWAEAVQNCFTSKLFPLSHLGSAISVMAVIGGSLPLFRLGGPVYLHQKTLVDMDDSLSTKAVLLWRSESHAEVALLGGQEPFTINTQSYGRDNLRVSPGNKVDVATLKVSIADISPGSDTSIDFPSMRISSVLTDIVSSLFTSLYDGLIGTSPKFNSDAFLEADNITRQLLLLMMTSKVLHFVVNSGQANFAGSECFQKALNLALREASFGGLHVTESVEVNYSSALWKYCFRNLMAADADVKVEASSKSPERTMNIPRLSARPATGLLAAVLGRSIAAERDADPNAVDQMVELGISRDLAEIALRRTRNNIELAINMCFEHGPDMLRGLSDSGHDEQIQPMQPSSILRLLAGEFDDEPLPRGLVPSLGRLLGNPAIRRANSDVASIPSGAIGGVGATVSGRDSVGRIFSNPNNELPASPEHADAGSLRVLNSISGNAVISSSYSCKVETGGGFPSVGCNGYGVMYGKWYYECEVLAGGCCQVGWADSCFVGASSDGEGVGDDSNSWAFDGYRRKRWHEISDEWGLKWKANDVVGCAIDMDTNVMSFYLNGMGEEVGMGDAFVNFTHNGYVYPAASFNRGEEIAFNFKGPFRFPPPPGHEPFGVVIEKRQHESQQLSNSLSLSQPYLFNDCLEEISEDSSSILCRYFPNESPVRKILEGPPRGSKLNALSAGKYKTAQESLVELATNLSIFYARLTTLAVLRSFYDSSRSDDKDILSGRKVWDDKLGSLLKLFRHCALSTARTKLFLDNSNLSELPSTNEYERRIKIGGSAALSVFNKSFLSLLRDIELAPSGSTFELLVATIRRELQLTTVREVAIEFVTESTCFVPLNYYNGDVVDSISLGRPNVAFAFWISRGILQLFSNDTTDRILILQELAEVWAIALKSCSSAIKSFGLQVLSDFIEDLLRIGGGIPKTVVQLVPRVFDLTRRIILRDMRTFPLVSQCSQRALDLCFLLSRSNSELSSNLVENFPSSKTTSLDSADFIVWTGVIEHACQSAELSPRLRLGDFVTSKHLDGETAPPIGKVSEITTWETGAPGSAILVSWIHGSTEKFRWGHEFHFDVVRVDVDEELNIIKEYPMPSPSRLRELSKVSRLASFGIILRTSVQTFDFSCSRSSFKGFLEFPDFASIIEVSIERLGNGVFRVTEESLVYGISDSGWTSRFGSSHWKPGTTYELSKTYSAKHVDGELHGSYAIRLVELSSSIVGTISLQRSNLFWFDKTCSSFKLSENRLGVTNVRGGKGLAFGHIGFNVGVHYWEYKVERGDSGSIFIGVAEKPLFIDDSSFMKWFGVGVVNNRTCFNSYRRAPGGNVYGHNFSTGDFVGVMLDMNLGRLAFFLNGLKYGEHVLQDFGKPVEGLTDPSRLRPKTLFPVIGMQRSLDRIVVTSKWLSDYSGDTAMRMRRAQKGWNSLYDLSRYSGFSIISDAFLRDSWEDWCTWRQGSHLTIRPRFGSSLINLDSSVEACVQASLLLGLTKPLYTGDRIQFFKSAGRPLAVVENAEILGVCKSRHMWYRTVGNASRDAPCAPWFLDRSDVKDFTLIDANTDILPEVRLMELPRISYFGGGPIEIILQSGVTMRDCLELDNSEILCTIPFGSVVFSIERRINSSNIVRFCVIYSGKIGWISEYMSGMSDDAIVRIVNITQDAVDSLKAEALKSLENVDCTIPLEEVSFVEDALRIWQAKVGFRIEEEENFDLSFELFRELISLDSWELSDDIRLIAIMSQLAGKDVVAPFNLPYAVLSAALSAENFHGLGLDQLLARASLLRVFNWYFVSACPFMSWVDPVEIFDSTYKFNDEVPSSSTEEVIIFRESTALRLRQYRNLYFTQIKRNLLDTVLNATETVTTPHQDEYEDPREIKELKLNRVQASPARLALIAGSSERLRKSVFGQLFKEMKTWPNAAMRRSYIAHGHGGQKRAFKVKFVGEGVNDYGGPYRAVFEQALDELQGDDHVVSGSRGLLPLLVPCPNRSSAVGNCQDLFVLAPGRLSSDVSELIRFFGKLLGMAVRQDLPMALDLPSLFWLGLVQSSIHRRHLGDVDVLLMNHLAEVERIGESFEKDESIPQRPDEWADLFFCTYLSDGSQIDLLPNGSSIPVNSSNWRRYISLTERARLSESSFATKSFMEGLSAVLPKELLYMFTSDEAQVLFCGVRKLSVDVLRKNTDYENIAHDSKLSLNFWEVLEEMTDEEKTSFLRFVVARSRLPSSFSETSKFKLQKDVRENPDSYLPHASTCFFTLFLPDYSSKDVMRVKLLYAIKNTTTMDGDVRLHSGEGWS